MSKRLDRRFDGDIIKVWKKLAHAVNNSIVSQPLSNVKGISKNFDWAFIHKKGHARDREQYMELCHSCHLIYDRSN